MKHLKIVLALTLVVLVASLAVFFVEGITTPIIDDYNFEQANAAKFTVLPTLTSSDDITPTTNYDFTDTSITELIIVEGKGYIYTAQFQGYQSQITYMVGLDLEGNITGYKTLLQGDTPGLGAEIANPDFYPQFVGMSTDTAASGDFDGLSGASVTTGGFKSSLAKVMGFHKVQFEGAVVETEAQKLARWKQEITVSDATFTDVSGDYTLPSFITAMEFANDGSTDVAVIYQVAFDGRNDLIEYWISFDLVTNEVLGFRVLAQAETPGYGAKIEEEARWEQFVGLGLDDALSSNFDGIAGATETTDPWKASIEDIASFHQATFVGFEGGESDADKTLRLIGEIYPTANTFTDVTRKYAANHDVRRVFEVYNGSEFLGVAYFVEAVGASYSEPTVNQFVIGIDMNRDFVGFRMFYLGDTSGITDAYLDPAFGASFTGQSIDSVYTVDSYAGATFTGAAFKTAIDTVVAFHNDNGIGRPDLIDTTSGNILAAFPGATSYRSVYLDVPYSGVIYNLYEVLNGSSEVIGYVYYAHADGNASVDIQFTYGVNLAGVTQQIVILNNTETWADAEEYGNYDGSVGIWPNTTWLNQFEGVSIPSLIATPVDAVAGVTNTTFGMLDAIGVIAEYHIDNSIGGAE
ncbi:MAG: FMN-binding protein [Bacilli bacterium]|nr:FMN-binding protein [Bacilli bacterium]